MKPKFNIGDFIIGYAGNNALIRGKIIGVDNRRSPYFYTIQIFEEKKMRETGIWESEIVRLDFPNKTEQTWIDALSANKLDWKNKEVGLKYDDQKPDYTLVTKELMDAVSRGMGYGLKKYTRDNYKLFTSKDIIRFKAALLRHAVAWANGEEIDTESGLFHADHIGSTLNIILWLKENKRETK